MLPGEKKYPHIFSPGRIGKMEAKNRIKYASTETNFNYVDGFVADKEVAYMEAQARGGAGMVTTQGAFTDPSGEGKGYVGMMGIWDDKFIPGLKRIADVIHKYDSKAVLQLMHCGRVGGIHLDYTVGPSVVPQRLPRFREPVEMTVEAIEECIDQHVKGALRCVEADFDAVEISGIVGYLLSNFISAYTNKREDDFGGSPEKRAEFPRRIVEGIRKAVGDDYPIIIRLCGRELLDDRGGNTAEESRLINKIIMEAGADCLSVTAGWQESAESVISRDCPQGSWLWIAKEFREVLPEEMTIAMAYRLFLPEQPEQAIAEGYLDFWESCRAMISDPFLPLKIMEDRQEEIRPCMACNICLARLFRDAELNCMVRPSLGHESEPEWGFYGFHQAEKKKKVWIVGAGLAGLNCGMVAAERGHEVTIFDREERPGGQFAAASHGPWGDDEFMRLVDWGETMCRKHGAELRLGTEVTREMIDEARPDVVVMATGATPEAEVPGADLDHVFSCLDVFHGRKEIGDQVVILGGKGTAISTALFLLHEKPGVKITIVDPVKKLGLDVNPSYIWRYKKKMKEGGVVQMTKCSLREIRSEAVVVETPEGEVKLPCDSVILADMQPYKPFKAPVKEGREVFIIGDALITRRGNSAILDGYRLGMSL
jgi:2,4-dienoyl-CoA reductase (NADPH2)